MTTEQKPEGRNVGLSAGLERCPHCRGEIVLSQQAGGRGCTDSTSYQVDCPGCGLRETDFPVNCSGRRRDAEREWNRWAKKKRALRSNTQVNAPCGRTEVK